MNTATTTTITPDYPLPRGWFFGWRHAPSESVSGFHGFRRELMIWQQRMVDIGYELKVDGFYGEQTRDAARALQEKRGLKVDGKIGPVTWHAAWAE